MANKNGRPKVNIDWDLVSEMAEKYHTGTTIAARLGINSNTLEKAVKKKFNCTLSAYLQQKRAVCIEKIQSKQIEVAMSGNVVMLIWVGKQYLGQTDKQEVTNNIGVKSISELIRKIDESESEHTT